MPDSVCAKNIPPTPNANACPARIACVRLYRATPYFQFCTPTTRNAAANVSATLSPYCAITWKSYAPAESCEGVRKKMYTKRRRWRWGVGLALVGIGAMVTALFARPEPLLLSRAVSTERTIKLPYYWLAGQELLILGNRDGGYESAHPMRYNVATKTTTELPILKEVLDTLRIDDKRIRVSPDGHRLLLRAGERDSYVVRVDGTELHSWDCVWPQ